MSVKDCGNHGHSRRKVHRRVFACFLMFIIAVLFTVLIVWLILRPTKPKFTLQDATVYQFNVSTGSFVLSSNMQVTVLSRNPNDRIGVYYDKLDIYASYRGQQITLANNIMPTYQGHNDINIWSPYLEGTNVPVAPYLAVNLQQDQAVGRILVNIKIDGRVRWKVGTWTSGRYHMWVNCPAYLTFGSKYPGLNFGGSGAKFTLDQGCNVDV